MGINGLNSGAPNFGIPGTQPDEDEDEDAPYSSKEDADPRRGKAVPTPTFVPAEYVDDDQSGMGFNAVVIEF